MRIYQTLNDEQIDYIVTHRDTEKLADIAKHLGCSVSTVYYHVDQLGLKKVIRKWTSEEVNRFIELKAQGYKTKDVADIIGRPLKSCYDKWLTIKTNKHETM